MEIKSINRGQDAEKLLDKQPCVKAIKKAKLNPILEKKLDAFIKRNIILECGRVSPNCLKAHLIKTAQDLKLPKSRIKYLKRLFKSRIGYKGYYLDAGRLRKV